MKVYHLSHIDLDGYGCQLVSSEFFKDITYYNANYGREVMVRINMILDSISEYKIAKKTILFGKEVDITPKDTSSKDNIKDFLILITDLNLTLNECKILSSKVKDLKLDGLNVNILLLDHHATGKECASLYSWYNLDVNRCATKITYEYFLEHFSILDSNNKQWLTPMVEMINSVDIWLEDGFGFEFGKVAMSMIASSSEISRNMFDNENRALKLDLLRMARKYLIISDASKKGGLIEDRAFDEVAFDNDIFFLKKALLGGDEQKETMDNIISRKQVELLSKKKEECKIFYEDKVGFLSYGVGGISVIANLFLSKNEEFDFYIDVSNRGSVSLRSNGNCDVSSLSASCFNGGGHKNASGGRVDSFKESYFYKDIKEQIQGHLSGKDEWEL